MKKYILLIACLSLISLNYADIIWEDGFETITGWELAGEFEIGAPTGVGGNYGNPDPDSAAVGTNVLGVDLTGLNTYLGDYEINLTERQYYAISPAIDCSMFSNVHLIFDRYLNLEQSQFDQGFIDISVDNGNNWIEIWTNDTTIEDDSWSEFSYDIADYADGIAAVKVRFSIGPSDGSWQYSGWNIDSFRLEGEQAELGQIEGTIVAESTNEPIADVIVIIDNVTTITDSLGQYVAIVPFGEANLSCFKEYYFYHNEPVEVDSEEPVIINIEMVEAYQPENFEAELIDEFDVHLSWDSPENPLNPLIGFSIFRDDALLVTVTENEFLDENLNYGVYTYSVQAIFMNSSSAPVQADEIAIFDYENIPPENLAYELLDDHSLILSWTNPDYDNVISFNVYKNNELVTSVVADTVEYYTEILPDGVYSFGVSALYEYSESDVAEVTVEVVDNDDNIEELYKTELYPAYPNPFNPETTISFSVQNDCHVKIVIYNVLGQKVKTLSDNQFQSGLHKIVWNGTNNKKKKVGSGIYFFRMMIDNKIIQTNKCMLIK